MKTFLLAFVAASALQLGAHASRAADAAADQLIPADRLATMDAANPPAADDDLRPPPHPMPHPPPYPHPHPPYPYPHPHPVPPPPVYYFWYECSAQDGYGNVYTDRGRDPMFTQRAVHNRCEEHSGTYCNDLGCRRI
jgi:hypothetical protein